MRILFSNTSRPKAVAASLRGELAVVGVTLPLRRSLEVVAKLFGYRDWNQLCTLAGREPPSPSDLDVDEASVSERRKYQAAALVRELRISPQLASALVGKIGPSRYGRPITTIEGMKWIVDGVLDGSLRDRLDKAARGIAAVGRPGFHRIYEFDSGFFYEVPNKSDGTVEHVCINGGVIAWRGIRPPGDLDWNSIGRGGLETAIRGLFVSPHWELGAWLKGLLAMGDYADRLDETGSSGEVYRRVVKHLGKMDLDLVASVAHEGLWHSLGVLFQLGNEGGPADPIAWFKARYPAFLQSEYRSGKPMSPEFLEKLEEHDGDGAAAFADLVGGGEITRRRAVRFLNKAARSPAVARAVTPFPAAIAMIGGRGSIPYDQDRFDMAFSSLDRQFRSLKPAA